MTISIRAANSSFKDLHQHLENTLGVVAIATLPPHIVVQCDDHTMAARLLTFLVELLEKELVVSFMVY